nr:glycosyltransferase family 2 protein [Geodermatophilaceae bacterium]
HVAAICRNATTFHRTWGAWPMEGWLAAFADDGLIAWTPFGDRCDLVDASAVAPTGRGT